MDQRFRARRATGNVHIYRHDFIHSLARWHSC